MSYAYLSPPVPQPKKRPGLIEKHRRVRINRSHTSEWRRKREACVRAVWVREEGRCQNPECEIVCIPPKDAVSPAQENIGHVHEEPMRSKGGDPLNPDDCVLTCQKCHDRRHRKRQPWISGETVEAWKQLSRPRLAVKEQLDAIGH